MAVTVPIMNLKFNKVDILQLELRDLDVQYVTNVFHMKATNKLVKCDLQE